MDTLIYCILSNRSSKANALLRYGFDTKGLLPYLRKNTFPGKDLKNYTDDLPASLKDYVTNFNIECLKNGKCEILGRDDEIFELWNIISKKTKSNAILIGAPGVGKTAVVEALTYNILNKKCPKKFRNYTIYSMTLNNMVAGTSYRGQFEEKIKHFLSFIEQTKNVIIFIDEIHQILLTGKTTENEGTFSDALKPALARDDIIVIGTTTSEEYKKIIAKSGALDRRFEIVTINEPKFKEVKPMIKTKVNKLSEYHKVNVSDKMLDKVQIFASSFSDRANPDKTLDLLDRSMAIASIENASELSVEHIEKVYKKNFELYKKTPITQRRAIAYHEAGHCLAWILSKTRENQDLISVSIIPVLDKGWNGVTMYETCDVEKHAMDIDMLKEVVSGLLAGRIAQNFVNKKLDSGAREDLQKASKLVEEYMLTYGFSESYMNYSFDTYLDISDNMTDDIRKKTREFINEVYKDTEKMLRENRKALDNIAKILLEKGIITKAEAMKAFYMDKPKRIKKRIKSNTKIEVVK